MRELLGRLSALDVGAESAVRVIAFFDALSDGHAGLDALMRGAAALAQAPVGLASPSRHVHLRVGPDGHRLPEATVRPEPGWPVVDLHDGLACVWIERDELTLQTDPMVLERLAAAVAPVLERTRGRAPVADPELVEVVLDPEADARSRAVAARRLGLPTSPLRVIASFGPAGSTRAAGSTGAAGSTRAAGSTGPAGGDRWRVQIGSVQATICDQEAGGASGGRHGIGPAAGAAELPRSWQCAVLALRLTCDDTDDNPGPTTLRFDDLGPLALIADMVSAERALVPDVASLKAVRDQWSWGLRTLVSLSRCSSLRQAATELRVHHSTLQERVGPLEAALGYHLGSADGRQRLYLSLQLYRLHASGLLP